MGTLRTFIAVCLAVALSACTTIDGRPTSVISTKQADSMVSVYRPDEAIKTLGNIQAPDARNTYRNRVAAAYLTAIDVHYGDFLRDLSRSGKGAHLGFDGVLLAVTGAGAIFKKAASNLSAGATALAGARSSFDRELFADKTLPIIISLMDSRRLAVRGEIIRGLSRPESTYTLEDAFSDLARYEQAGSIDGALIDAAADAGKRAEDAKYDFSKAKDLCVVDTGTDDARRALMVGIESFENDAEAADGAKDAQGALDKRKTLQTIAQRLGMADAAAPTDQTSAYALLMLIRDQIEAQCNSAQVAALKVKITSGGGFTLP